MHPCRMSHALAFVRPRLLDGSILHSERSGCQCLPRSILNALAQSRVLDAISCRRRSLLPGIFARRPRATSSSPNVGEGKGRQPHAGALPVGLPLWRGEVDGYRGLGLRTPPSPARGCDLWHEGSSFAVLKRCARRVTQLGRRVYVCGIPCSTVKSCVRVHVRSLAPPPLPGHK